MRPSVMHIFELGKKYDSTFFVDSFENSIKTYRPPQKKDELLIDGEIICKNNQLKELYTDQQISALRSRGAILRHGSEEPRTQTIVCKIGETDRHSEYRINVELYAPDVYFTKESEAEMIVLAKSVLAELVNLDRNSRSIFSDPSDKIPSEPSLAKVSIWKDRLELNYWETLCNAAWYIYYTLGEDGKWHYETWG